MQLSREAISIKIGMNMGASKAHFAEADPAKFVRLFS